MKEAVKKKKKERESSIPLEVKKASSEGVLGTHLFLGISDPKTFARFPSEWATLLNCPYDLRATIYPTFLSANEEYQLPLSGQEHWVVCLSGQLVVAERSSGQQHQLDSLEWVRITRRDNTEFPNLKMVSSSAPAKVLWIIAHKI